MRRVLAARWGASARGIAALAWPVFVGQVAVLGFSTVDTVVVARHASLDLAALAIGAAAYITVFIGLMGVVLAIGPIAGQHFGAGRLAEAGAQLQQAGWLAVAMAVVGSLLLLFPQPFLALAQAPPEVAAKARAHLGWLALALPPALLFTAFRGFNTAVSRPKVVMAIQLGALLPKIPLTVLLVSEYGVAGCGLATAIVNWLQLAAGITLLRRDPFYHRFGLQGAVARPSRASLRQLLALGLPMGGTFMVEVTAFSFMALFISRLGAMPVAGHQLAMNIVSLMFMLSLAISNAGGTLVAQRVGAGDLRAARRIGWHTVEIGCAVAALLGATVYSLREPIVRLYTTDAAVHAVALPLLAPLVVFHIADAAQVLAASVLRAWRVATLPMLIYVVALWGVGVGGGNLLAFGHVAVAPPALRGAIGFWVASTVGLVIASSALIGLLRRHVDRAIGATVKPAG